VLIIIIIIKGQFMSSNTNSYPKPSNQPLLTSITEAEWGLFSDIAFSRDYLDPAKYLKHLIKTTKIKRTPHNCLPNQKYDMDLPFLNWASGQTQCAIIGNIKKNTRCPCTSVKPYYVPAPDGAVIIVQLCSRHVDIGSRGKKLFIHGNVNNTLGGRRD
jgi:hypothetical protein